VDAVFHGPERGLSNSLINNGNLISKVYFPRLIVPIAMIVVAFTDFLISFCILVLLSQNTTAATVPALCLS
jgi:lipopolysaccharide transport system permease protein